jgi:hypothetical protein
MKDIDEIQTPLEKARITSTPTTAYSEPISGSMKNAGRNEKL